MQQWQRPSAKASSCANTARVSPSSSSSRVALSIVTCLFFLSGATALVAEVALNKMLTYVFGSSHMSTSTVLAAYMAGLSAGAWLFGNLGAKYKNPVYAYAALEALVGVFYFLLPLVFPAFQRAGVSLASPWASSPVLLTAVRFGLSFLLVFIPTLMMGGTLPTLISAFQKSGSLSRNLPLLYAVNTLGAAFGVLLGSYVLLPKGGLSGALYLCGAVNFGIAAASVLLAKRVLATYPDEASAPSATSAVEASGFSPTLALGLSFAQGAVAFSLEVVWFHLIGTVIGVTTYAFAIMLFSILLGIGMGSLWLPRVQRWSRLTSAQMFVACMTIAALAVGLGLRGWDKFSTVIAWTWRLQEEGHFWGRELVRLGFCLALLLPTTLALGMSLPSLAASVRAQTGQTAAQAGAWVGKVFAFNTLGTIVGSLGCGFLLLGRLGSERILQLGALAALALALAAAYQVRASFSDWSKVKRLGLASAVFLALGATLSFVRWDARQMTLGSHYYWSPPDYGQTTTVEWLREDAQSGFITVMRNEAGVRIMRTNGKYEGNSEPGEFQDLFALLGGLYVKHYERAAMVGMGPARTLGIMHAMPFKKIEAVEYSPATIAAAKEQFAEFSGAPMADTARVSVFCDDGRNHLQLAKGPYDYVAIAISGAAFAGAGNIYSQDFFRAVASKLEADGVLMLWIQVHHVFPSDVRSVIHTLRTVFPSVHFYTNPAQDQGFLFASKIKLEVDPERVAALDKIPRVQEVLGYHGMSSAMDLVERSMFTTEPEFERYMQDASIGAPPQVLTDLFPAFEYSTPYALAQQIGSFDFQQFSGKELPPMQKPLTEVTRLHLLGRRKFAAGDTAGARASWQEAKKLSGTTIYDAWILRMTPQK
jgi:spermidine synthase